MILLQKRAPTTTATFKVMVLEILHQMVPGAYEVALLCNKVAEARFLYVAVGGENSGPSYFWSGTMPQVRCYVPIGF